MNLAYLYAKSQSAERIFLDVFSDEGKYIDIHKKLGFKVIGSYEWLLPVTVMMMDYQTDYEQGERAKVVKAAEEVTRTPQSLFAGHPL